MTNLENFITEVDNADMACANIFKMSNGIARSIEYSFADLKQLVKEYNGLIDKFKVLEEQLKNGKSNSTPESKVIIEDFATFVDPEECSDNWEEIQGILKKDFNKVFDYYCGVFDSLKCSNHIYIKDLEQVKQVCCDYNIHVNTIITLECDNPILHEGKLAAESVYDLYLKFEVISNVQ